MGLGGRVLVDISVVAYAVSLVLLFVDVIQPRRTINRTALVLLSLVFVAETVTLLGRLRQLGTLPVYSSFDILLLLAWLILLSGLVLATIFRIDLILFFVNVLGFGLVAFATFGTQSTYVFSQPQGDVLVLHISTALLSYVAFAFSVVFAVMYLLQQRALRRKQWNHWYFRLPPLERLDTYALRGIMIGFPLLLISMVLGLIWGKLTFGTWLVTDPKPMATLILWFMYGAYLILRMRVGFGDIKLVWFNVSCFLGVVVNLAVVGAFSGFHHAL